MASILIAHDDPALLRTLRSILAASGHTVATTSDATATTHLLASGAFDGALVNIHLPGAADAGLVARLREHVRRGEPRLGVVALAPTPSTAGGVEETLGAEVVVATPLTATAVLRALGRVLNVDPSTLAVSARRARLAAPAHVPA